MTTGFAMADEFATQGPVWPTKATKAIEVTVWKPAARQIIT